MRLFVAINLPESITQQGTAICEGLPGVRWTKPEQMHLTLRFIGEVNEEQATAIKAALARIEFNPFAMHLQGVGPFPPRGTARVLWVGINAPDNLDTLARQIETTLTADGLTPADRHSPPISPWHDSKLHHSHRLCVNSSPKTRIFSRLLWRSTTLSFIPASWLPPG